MSKIKIKAQFTEETNGINKHMLAQMNAIVTLENRFTHISGFVTIETHEHHIGEPVSKGGAHFARHSDALNLTLEILKF